MLCLSSVRFKDLFLCIFRLNPPVLALFCKSGNPVDDVGTVEGALILVGGTSILALGYAIGVALILGGGVAGLGVGTLGQC